MTSTRHFILSASMLATLAISTHARATGCEEPIYCDITSLDVVTTALDDGQWQYDYTFDLRSAPNRYEPESRRLSYDFVAMRIPYFDDAGITDLKVGSEYAGLIQFQIEDVPLGQAAKSIVVAAVGRSVLTKRPATLVSGVNTLLSFQSGYAPANKGAAAVPLMRPFNHQLLTLRPDPRYGSTLVTYAPGPAQGTIAIPGSPAAVPEPEGIALLLGGLATVAVVRRAKADQRSGA